MFAKKYLSQNRVVFPVGLKYDEKKSRKRGYPCKIIDPPPPQGWQQLTLDSVPWSFRLNSLGLVLGPVSGVLAVDIDNMELWKVVLDTLGETEPLTCRSISQRRAVHLLFKVTPALEAVHRKGVFNMKPLGYNDFNILGQGDFLLVPPSSFETPEGRREYTFVEGYSLLDNLDKLMEAPDWLIEVLTRGSAAYRCIREAYLKQTFLADKEQEHKEPNKALLDLDTHDHLKEVEKHVKKLNAERAIDCQSWIEVGMAIHHATDGQGMELWDTFSKRAGPYDRRDLEYQWDSFKNGSRITMGSLIHWSKEDAKKKTEERKVAKEKEDRTKNDEVLRCEAVKFGVNHTGGKGVFDSWDAEKSVAVIRNTMHHPNHRVECVFNSDGGFQRCLECDWRNPFAGELVVSQSNYPVLHQQFFNVTINNTVHIYQGDLKPEGKSWVGPKAKVVLEYAQQNGFLRESGYIYKPIHKWAIQCFERKGKPCDYKGFVNMVFEGDAMKVWEQPGVVSTLASIMEDSDADSHFPLVTRDHRFTAFKNSVWDLQTLTFYDLSTEGPGDIIAGHYFDVAFPSGQELCSLETPKFDNLVRFQIADPEV
ncbi:hypothetical protein HK102_005437, partial [Quaeritorhiza haematococci]